MSIKVFTKIAELKKWRQGSRRIALVPTMGNLHAGHLGLMRCAQKYAEAVIASIYVNPTQFGVNEDYGTYPRTQEHDLELLEQVKVEAAFLPSDDEIYPHGLENAAGVSVPSCYTGILCGESRPTHFQGVLKVVPRLFNLTQAEVAVFGEKDFQQLWLIRYAVQDMHMPIEIIGAPIVRAEDGLALSSRNQYLSKEERQRAPLIYQHLQKMRDDICAGEHIDEVIEKAKKYFSDHNIVLDYLEFRDCESLEKRHDNQKSGRLFFAGKIGSTRLIDNILIEAQK